ncbi:autotransporter-associated N-terminal domain-containing protein [Leptotrichia sp.]|uniref:autotransporter-associated N-terminal domain-containing protein n=1 Tax=Leptotrichia sp. TaxID=104608 RepID=UPI0017CCB2CB|nr:autotransporter-associated N-terminal domain-containing protein [Leptotrichia sp.]MBB1535307.1 autotransporter-associated N-terminal domain-containing protein [Leptotrichia sp.]
MSNNLRQLSKDLKAFAKRCKDFRYTEQALLAFLLTGILTFSEIAGAPTTVAIKNQRQEINTSISDIHREFKKARTENDKLIKDYNLELIKLMEQGDHVVKSPWSSWQYAANGFYNDWQGRYKGRGDKEEKYPYEGIFKRSEDPYERNISLDSKKYSTLSNSFDSKSASSNRRELMKKYGIASTEPVREPIVAFDVNASIHPRNINKSAIVIASKTAITPEVPEAIKFTPPKPVISIPTLPDLPDPPTFNIQLGSFCNYMTPNCNARADDGGPYTGTGAGTPYSFSHLTNQTITSTDLAGGPAVRYAWQNVDSPLLKVYFDYGLVFQTGISHAAAAGGGGTLTLNAPLTIDSIRGSITDPNASVRTWNNQVFLVGGSRVATLDNGTNAKILNNNKIDLVGPLVIGFEMQSDTNNSRYGIAQGTREVENANIITDSSETSNNDLNTIFATNPNGVTLNLAPKLGGGSIVVKRKNGYTGYKIGLILTFENNDNNPTSKYILKNSGKIDFGGEKSIGIQIYAPGSPSNVEVSNSGTGTNGIYMGGIESYGMKWSSRVSDSSIMENTGTIEISGDAGLDTDGVTLLNSLSSGIAVIENSPNDKIRAYSGKVKNNGIINVSGGKGNTGMVLVVNATDDITNDTNGTINVSSTTGKQNIAMRVDKGSIPTDAPGTPKAINSGTINLDGDSSIGMVGTKADVINNAGKTIGTTTGKTIVNGIGMATSGGDLQNSGTINLKGITGTTASTNVGVYMEKNGTNDPTGTLASTSNITVEGNNSTGVLVKNGTLNYGGDTLAKGLGVTGLIVGDNGTNTAVVTSKSTGKIIVKDGTNSAGVFTYTEPSGTVKKGSYGIIVGKGSKFLGDTSGGTPIYTEVDVNVKEPESIGLYAGENAILEVGKHTVKADEGAVNYDADKGTIRLKGVGDATTGQKSLLFYLGDNGTGKVYIDGTMTAKIEGGANPNLRGTAFYYVGTGSSPFGATEIGNWAKNNFGDGTTSTLGHLTLDMEADSRLFIAQGVGMNLSDTTGDTVSTATGVHFTPTSTNYKTFMLYRSQLTINQDVNLDNSTDAYNQLEISNSSITNANTKTITGTANKQVAMAQENNKIYPRSDVILSNEGKINLSGTESTGIYGKYAELYNKSNGEITMGDKSTAIYGLDDSIVENRGKITIGSNSTGLYSEGATSQGIKNSGIIETSGNDSVAISYKPDATLGAGVVVENTGTINLLGDRNTGIYATGTPGYTAKNSGTITLGDSATISSPNVGLYTDHNAVTLENTGTINSGKNTIGIYGYGVNNSGDLNVGDAAVGIYSQNGNVNLTGGTITTGTDEAVGVYTVGNSQVITNNGTNFNFGDNSFGFVNVGSGNTIASNISNVGLGNKDVYIYSNDTAGTVTNNTNISSSGQENYGIYSAGIVTNNGDIDLSGIGSVAVYSVKGGTATNTGTIKVGASDTVNDLFSIGMGAGYGTTDTGNVINNGTIIVNGKNSIGMYASGAGSTTTNNNNIVLNADNTTGIYADEGATAVNTGTITSSGTHSNVVGVYLGRNSTLNNTGVININGANGVGVYLKGGTIANYGTITVNGSNDRSKTIFKFTTPPTGKSMGSAVINAPARAQTATVTINGILQTPVVINTFAQNPIEVSASSIGLYVNTSGKDYTNSITGLGNLTTEADLIIGTEATQMTNSKSILIKDPRMLAPYNDVIKTSGVTKWNIYSGGLNWLATPTLNPSDGTMTSIYMVKVPYTDWAGRETTPVNSTDTYNFLDGLEQRYGVEWYGDRGERERELFSKLNNIGNNEEVLFYQATDEMMGHQYGNLQQRINETGNLLDKEFKYMRNEWRNPSKQNNKIKVFGMRNEYNTDTAGIIDYTSNAYGVAYVHEDEAIKLGHSKGWYAGIVNNRFRFKDIGKSRENQTMLKAGIFKTVSPYTDYNGSLRWTIGADAFIGRNEMKRRFLVVDDIFNAKGDFNSYGVALKTDLGYDIRLSERMHLRPYGALKMEYGRFSSIKEDTGEIRLEVDGNDYFSVKPEVGVEFKYVQPMAVRTQLSVGLAAAYENELGRVANGKNKARVRYTNADWFGIRGEKDDRRGNAKFDLNIGVDNTRFGVTINAGYDTKGENIRGGLGFRAIY